MKHDIFISYKSQDIAVTKAIAHIMKLEDIFCWYAPRNLDNQAAGKDYDDKIVEAIKACKIVIVLLCDESLESEWVKFEVSCAQKNKKFIIPYVIRELTVDNGLLNRLTTKHWIDAYPNPEKKFNILLNNVKLAMSQLIENDKDSEDLRNFAIESHQDFENDFDYEEGEVLYAAKETVDAVRAFLTSAENDNPKAKKMLCRIFYDLEGNTSIIPNDLWEIIDRQAKLGHCYANFLMHTKYYNVNESEFISFEYLKKAIKDNSIPEAFLRLGIHYGWGIGVKQSHTLEMHYYNKAASMGMATAYSYIGQVYESGNDKFEENIELAIENYNKGAAANNKRALKNLCWLYYSNESHKDLDKARAIAQKAIDCGYEEGYVWMGDTYYWTLDSDKMFDIDECEEARQWYKKAATKEVKGSYSSLANMYWNAGEHEKAFRWAHNGVMHGDRGSFQALGWFYEHEDGQYEEAWKYYHKNYANFGSGAENLARLYIDYEHRPSTEDYKIENLISALEVCAKNSNETCIDYLISIYTKDKFGIEPSPQKAMEYERLGAQMGFDKYIHEFGLRFFNKEDKQNYNPYRGMQWIEKSAQKMYKDSVLKLIEISGPGGIEPDSSTHEKWCDFALVNGLEANDKRVFMNYIRNSAIYKDEYTTYLLGIAYDKGNTPKTRGEAYKALISGHHMEGRQLPQTTYDQILAKVRNEIDDNISLSYCQDIMADLYPDFNHKALENGSIEINDDALERYYMLHVTDWEYEIALQHQIQAVIYKDILTDSSYAKSRELKADIFKKDYWHKFYSSDYCLFTLFDKICKNWGLKAIEQFPFTQDDMYPAMTSRIALAMRYWATSSLLHLIRSGRKPFADISITDTDERILNIAEKETDATIQMYLVSFVELMLETHDVLMDSYNLMDYYNTRNYEKIAVILNEYKSQLESCDIEHSLPLFDEEYVKNIIDNNPIYELREKVSNDNGDVNDSKKHTVADKTSESSSLNNDEFDRLLDEFISQQLKKQEEED